MREAVLSVADADMTEFGIDELVALCRSAGLEALEELECRATGAVIRVEVESPIDEDRLAALAYVNWWERLESSGDGHQYVVSFTSPTLSERAREHASDLVGTCDPDVTERGATMSLVGPQEAITGLVGEYERVGISPEIRKLATYEGGEESLDRLTSRQREVIHTAFEMGYYEVPREVGTDDVARALDLDPSTVTEHLQRAERNLLAQHLSSGE